MSPNITTMPEDVVRERAPRPKRSLGATIEYISPQLLRSIGFNAPARTSPPRLRSLHRSIARVGILEPILITEDRIIVNGHRRVACAKALGLVEVPVVYTTIDKLEAYAEANTASSKLSARDIMETALKNEDAVPRKWKVRVTKAISRIGGVAVAQELVNRYPHFHSGMVAQAGGLASRVFNGRTEEMLMPTLLWIMDQGPSYNMARGAAQMGYGFSAIADAIERNVPLSSEDLIP